MNRVKSHNFSLQNLKKSLLVCNVVFPKEIIMHGRLSVRLLYVYLFVLTVFLKFDYLFLRLSLSFFVNYSAPMDDVSLSYNDNDNDNDNLTGR